MIRETRTIHIRRPRNGRCLDDRYVLTSPDYKCRFFDTVDLSCSLYEKPITMRYERCRACKGE